MASRFQGFSSTSGGQRTRPLSKRPTAQSRRTVAARSSSSTDRPGHAGEVPWADALTDPDTIPDGERRELVARLDRLEQTSARVDRRRNRAEMSVEFALGDRVEQRALRLPPRARHRPATRAAASRATGHQTVWSPPARTDRFRHDRRRADRRVAGEIDAFELDDLIHHSSERARAVELVHARRLVGRRRATLKRMREKGRARRLVRPDEDAPVASLDPLQRSLALSRISISVGRRRCCSRRRSRYSPNASDSPADSRGSPCARRGSAAAERYARRSACSSTSFVIR